MQPVHRTDDGVIRFVDNPIILHLVASYEPGLTELRNRFSADPADFDQLLMLVGCSVREFEHTCSSGRAADAARRAAATLGRDEDA